jgi:selenocysteine-specific elongation factor
MATQRKNIMLGTAGHVDHGKTALVKVLTGCDTDTLAEEKQRGLTIDLGFAPCKMADERIVGIVDVPGHVDFIRNMVAGAHGIDVVIFVVAADDGVMPQTREHLDILTLMGVRQGIIALTKVDLVDATMRQMAIDDVRQFVTGTFLHDKCVCPISNVTGEGFDGLFSALNAAVNACEPRQTTGLFRTWVEDVFSIRGFGTVVTGIPVSGEVKLGDHLRVVPGGQVGRVRGLEVYGQQADIGRAGECVAINLADAEPESLRRGAVLCEADAVEAPAMIEGELRLLDRAPQALEDYGEVHLHIGTAETMAHVALLEGKRLAPGGRTMVQLRLAAPLGAVPGERFVIRANVAGPGGGRVATIGGGRVLGTSNIRLRRNRPWTLESLAARREAIDSPSHWCLLHLKEAGKAMDLPGLARATHLRPGQVQELLAAAKAGGTVLEAGAGQWVHPDVVKDVVQRVKAALEEFHNTNPIRLGLSEGDLAAGLQVERGVLALAVEAGLRNKLLQRQGELLALAGRKARVSPEDVELCQRIEEAIKSAGLAPSSPAELAASLGQPENRINALLLLLADQGTVVRLDPKVVMHRDAVQTAKQVVLDLFTRTARPGAPGGSFETVEFRDALGVSRKYAVPLLDYFDTIHLTVRSGSRRTPGKAARP